MNPGSCVYVGGGGGGGGSVDPLTDSDHYTWPVSAIWPCLVPGQG